MKHIETERRASPAGRGITEIFDKNKNFDIRQLLKKRRSSPVGCESALLYYLFSFRLLHCFFSLKINPAKSFKTSSIFLSCFLDHFFNYNVPKSFFVFF
jgi:hypothetical protein